MKVFALSFMLSLVGAGMFSQNVAGVNPRQIGSGMFLRNYFTTPFESKEKYSGIEGSPYIDESWTLARLYVDSVQFFDSIKIRINAYENRVHFLDESNEEFQATGLFQRILIIDKDSKWFGVIFRSGLYEQPNIYFQVMTDGPKAQLLQKIKIEKWVTKAVFEESKTIFQPEKELFFATHNNLIKQNKDCAYLKELTAGNKVMLQFIKDNMLKCNKEADMKRIVQFINAQ